MISNPQTTFNQKSFEENKVENKNENHMTL